MRILVCGGRNWEDKEFMRNIINDIFDKGDILITGCAKGADTMAWEIILEDWVDFTGEPVIKVLPFPAYWNKYGKSAGIIRNKQMLDEGKPNLVLAFYNDISKSKGTLDMIKQSNKAGVEVRLYSNKGVR